MTPSMIGTFGVALLLIAFILNLLKRLPEDGPLYLSMNFVGAAAAAWYAFASGAIPFIVLEVVWASSALIRLIFRKRKGSSL